MRPLSPAWCPERRRAKRWEVKLKKEKKIKKDECKNYTKNKTEQIRQNDKISHLVDERNRKHSDLHPTAHDQQRDTLHQQHASQH